MASITKVLRVFKSELALDERMRYLRNALFRRASRAYALRGGARVNLRPGTTDKKVFDEVFVDRVYDPLLPVSGVRTIVDLGANVGFSTIALLRAYPQAVAIAVEPDMGNFEAMLENLKDAGVDDRCLPMRGFVGGEAGLARLEDSGNGEWGMRMGPRALDGIPVFTIPGLASRANVDQFDLVKCDIEGSERELFQAIQSWDFLVRYMVLELHADLFPVSEFDTAMEQSSFAWSQFGQIARKSPLSVIALKREADTTEQKQIAVRK